MIIAAIEAKDKSDVVVIDILNALIHTQQPYNEKVIISLRGIIAKIVCMIESYIYQPYVQLKRGETLLNVKALNAIYGAIKSALLL